MNTINIAWRKEDISFFLDGFDEVNRDKTEKKKLRGDKKKVFSDKI